MSLKNVIVTGGGGYIGSHVVLALLETRRFRVISIDNYHNSHPKSLSRVSEIAKASLGPNPSESDLESATAISMKADLTDSSAIRTIFEKYSPSSGSSSSHADGKEKTGIHAVIHVAAYKAVGESGEIPITYFENNVAATLGLIRVMDDFKCKNLVYSSSATVYGIPPVVPIPETTAVKPESVYGRTKGICETMIQDICRSDKDWHAVSLRYFNPAGAHASGHIGEDPVGRPGNLLPLLAHMAIGRVKESVLKVFGNDYPTPDGTCVRDYIHVLDLAAGHLNALDALTPSSERDVFTAASAPEKGVNFRAYNLGKGQGESVLTITAAMRKATGVDFKTEIVGRRVGDVPDLTADPALAEKELGFKATRDLEEMCRDLWNWQTRNPQGYDSDSKLEA